MMVQFFVSLPCCLNADRRFGKHRVVGEDKEPKQ